MILQDWYALAKEYVTSTRKPSISHPSVSSSKTRYLISTMKLDRHKIIALNRASRRDEGLGSLARVCTSRIMCLAVRRSNVSQGHEACHKVSTTSVNLVTFRMRGCEERNGNRWFNWIPKGLSTWPLFPNGPINSFTILPTRAQRPLNTLVAARIRQIVKALMSMRGLRLSTPDAGSFEGVPLPRSMKSHFRSQSCPMLREVRG